MRAMAEAPLSKKAVPKSRILRTFLGVTLVIFGIFGFLPVLGFWMIPLGLSILAIDSPVARRIFRRMKVGWGRMIQRLQNRGG